MTDPATDGLGLREIGAEDGAPLNVVLLTVDALRVDRLSVYGYERPTTPNLSRLSENALVCEKAFTLAPFTQCACIQIFTSSRPLMHGGYDSGALGRPQTMFERFHEAGYRTSGLSNVHWVSPYYGYTSGLDEEYQLFHLNTLPGMAVGTFISTLRLYDENKISATEMVQKVVPRIAKLFDDIDRYCDVQLAHSDRYLTDFPDSKIVNTGYDYRKVKRKLKRHRRIFGCDDLAYINYCLKEILDTEQWLIREWYYCRSFRKLISEGLFRLVNNVVRRFDAPRARMRENRFKLCADASSLADKVISQLEERDTSRPFFIWAHFKDTHHPYVSGKGKKWYEETPDFLEQIGYSRHIDPGATFAGKKPKTSEESQIYSALYDAAVRSTDREIGRIADTIERLGLSDNTLIAICGDHGDEIGEHGDHGHTCLQYEHNVRVPMMFWRANSTPIRLDSLVTLIDFAPTVSNLAGIDPSPDWEGSPATERSVADREHVILETFCRGNCAFEHRPFYMAVRSHRYKYLWKEYRDPIDRFGPDGHELYDLEADPGEQNNLYRPDHPMVPIFNVLIARQLLEIPEVSQERIESCFGAGILAAEAPPAKVSEG